MLMPLALTLEVAATALGRRLFHVGVPLNAGLTDLGSLFANIRNYPKPIFPLSRDVIMIFVIALAMSTPAMVFQQWRGFKRVLGLIFDPQLFFFVDEGAAIEFRSSVERTASYLQKDGGRIRTAIRAVIAFGLGIGILAAQRSAGIYGIFRPSDSQISPQEWRTASYDQWWLNYQHDPVAAAVFLAIASTFSYLLLVQNTVNFRIFQLFHPFRNSFACGFDLDRPFDFYGWQPLRDALNVGELSMFIYGILIIIYLAVVTPQALVEWMAPLTLMYLIALPTFTIGPLRMFRRGRRRAKRIEVARLQQFRDSIIPLEEKAAIERKISTIRDEIPDNLYNLKRSVLTLLPLGLLFITLVFQILTLLGRK